jgi:hypothetical protein
MKIQKAIFIFFILFTTLQICFGQEKLTPYQEGLEIPKEPTNCEMNALYWDILWNTVKDAPDKNGFIIFIARLGTKEIRRDVNRRRLLSIKKIYKNRNPGIPQQFILAEGERVKGFGRVEFYWKGRLFGAFVLNKNRDICFSCCE